LQALNRLQERLAADVNRSLVGSVQEILVEQPGRKGGVLGRTRTNKIVTLDGDADLIGRTIRVEIFEAGSWVLRGRWLTTAGNQRSA
jgi:tRNA-2-methylthio-N6-dimethylallyladenosine synthase